MLQLWHGDARILQVTLRMLLGMRGGTGDYDDPGPSRAQSASVLGYWGKAMRYAVRNKES